MTSMVPLRQGIAARLLTQVTDAEVLWKEPDEPLLNSIVVGLDFPFADYEGADGSNLTMWRFVLTLICGGGTNTLALTKLGDWLDPKGPVIKALRDEDANDALTQMSNNNINVITASNYGAYHRNRDPWVTAQLKVMIRAN